MRNPKDAEMTIPEELLGLLGEEERRERVERAAVRTRTDTGSVQDCYDDRGRLLSTLASVLGRLRDTGADLVGARLELRRSEQRWSDAAQDITSMDNYRMKAELRAERAEAELAEERRLRVEAECGAKAERDALRERVTLTEEEMKQVDVYRHYVDSLRSNRDILAIIDRLTGKGE